MNSYCHLSSDSDEWNVKMYLECGVKQLHQLFDAIFYNTLGLLFRCKPQPDRLKNNKSSGVFFGFLLISIRGLHVSKSKHVPALPLGVLHTSSKKIPEKQIMYRWNCWVWKWINHQWTDGRYWTIVHLIYMYRCRLILIKFLFSTHLLHISFD